MRANENFAKGTGAACDTDPNGAGATPVEVLPPYQPRAQIEIGRVLNHPCTWILLGFAGGIWFANWMKQKN